MSDDPYDEGGWLAPGTATVVNKTGERIAVQALTADASGEHTSCCMIALMPTKADAQRLAVPGGESPDELHCTLWFLGCNADEWDPSDRSELVQELRGLLADRVDGPITAKVFGVNQWNGDTDTPSWVWSVGDQKDGGDAQLAMVQNLATQALESVHNHPDLPVQHSPWAAHICAAYDDNPALLPALKQHLGPVTFDRVRLSFGSDDVDIPLDDRALTAAAAPHRGVFRRRLTDAELRSGHDFAGHQRGWKSAVDAAAREWSGIQASWRNQIKAQLTASDTADALDGLTLDTSQAAQELYNRMVAVALASARAQERACRKQGVPVGEWTLDARPDLPSAVTAALGGRDFMRLVADNTAVQVASRMLASARGKAMGLSRVFSGIRLASEVDEFLLDLSDAYAREGLGGAITDAQATGTMAVLRVAPKGTYTASELLDSNTCKPCSQIDGKQFSTLDDAEKAYPGGGYLDCLGGARCRGQIIATWDQGLLSSAGGADMTTTEELGGAPNPGTKPDKRLRENRRKQRMNAAVTAAPCASCPDDADHFESEHLGTSSFAWDGAASRFSDAEYKEAAAACDPGPGTVKEKCFLPHHDPGGALNPDGLAAAAGRFSGLTGHSPQAVASAKAHLVAHYKQLGKDVPDNLKAAHDHDHGAALALSCPEGWKPDPDGDGCVPENWDAGDTPPLCPPGMRRDPDHDGCIPEGSAKASAVTAAAPVTDAPMAAPDIAPGAPVAPWMGVLAVEGITTGDGREFAEGALDWQDPPIPLRWNIQDSHGGEPRTVAVNVGRIDKIWRDGNKIMGSGALDLSDPNGVMARDKIAGNFLRGVSIDADSIAAPDVEFVYADPPEDSDAEGSILDMLFGAGPEKTVYHGGRIRAATLCDIPAFAEAYIALTDEEGAITAGGPMDPAAWVAARPAHHVKAGAVRHALTAGAAAVANRAPADWFTDPKLSLPTPITVDTNGRVYGHAALWGSCHIGQASHCVRPPREDYHAHYLKGEVLCAGGEIVSVGQITIGTGHAPITAGAPAAAEHYDNTGCAVADVTVGNDAHGIWVAGAIREDAPAAKVSALRAAGAVSGDWRRIGGKLRLVGLLAVNVPGFSIPKMRARINGPEQYALVAAGVPTVAPSAPFTGDTEAELDEAAMRRVMAMYARRVKGD